MGAAIFVSDNNDVSCFRRFSLVDEIVVQGGQKLSSHIIFQNCYHCNKLVFDYKHCRTVLK